MVYKFNVYSLLREKSENEIIWTNKADTYFLIGFVWNILLKFLTKNKLNELCNDIDNIGRMIIVLYQFAKWEHVNH